MDHGFVKVAAATITTKIADCNYNEKQIENIILQAENENVDIICFPELCITGYSCGDLFTQQLLLDSSETALLKLLDSTRSLNIIVIIGMPIQYQSILVNTAVVIQNGKILGIVPKTHLPNNRNTQEMKWFAQCEISNDTIQICSQTTHIGRTLLFKTSKATFGIEIGEDLCAPIQPSTQLALKGAEIIFNPSAHKEVISNYNYMCRIAMAQSARINSGYVIASCGPGESTQDSVFAGNGFILENGQIIAEGKRFCCNEQIVISEIDVDLLRHERRNNNIFSSCMSNNLNNYIVISCLPQNTSRHAILTRSITPHPFVPQNSSKLTKRCEEVFEILTIGLAQRILHTHAKTLIIGISGGLDSTLALLVCVKTLDKLERSRKDIIGITMPGFGTTNRTYINAISLMDSLGISTKEINIKAACLQHFKDINHNSEIHDITYENSQARERTQILMDIANQCNGLVVGTGDLSELALGWATYNGDHMSNYSVNSSVPKTLIPHIIKWVANTLTNETISNILFDIINTPISPELIPADLNGNIKQKTEDLVGPYELHDFFLYHLVRNGFTPNKIFFLAKNAFQNSNTILYDDYTIKKWLTIFCRRFFNQQFKRSCMPDGPKVGSVSLSPRGAWTMPSDANSTQWINECENI